MSVYYFLEYWVPGLVNNGRCVVPFPVPDGQTDVFLDPRGLAYDVAQIIDDYY